MTHPDMMPSEVIIGIHKNPVFYECCPIQGARMLPDVILGPGRILTRPWFTLVANRHVVQKAGVKALVSWPESKDFKRAVGESDDASNSSTPTTTDNSSSSVTASAAANGTATELGPTEAKMVEITKDAVGEVAPAEGIEIPEPDESTLDEIPVPSHIGGPPVIEAEGAKAVSEDSPPAVKKRRTRGPGKKTLERMRLAGLLPTAGSSAGSGNGGLTFKKMWDPKNPTNEVDFVIRVDSSYPMRDIEDPKNRRSDEFYYPGVYRLKRAKCLAAATGRFPEGTEWYVGKHGHGLPFALMQILESMPRYGHELDIEIRAVE
jgi:hypothetical protein